MKFGIGANINAMLETPTNVARVGEELGFESMWMGEHIIIPAEIQQDKYFNVQLPEAYRHMPNPFLWQAAAAAVTTKIKFGTCIVLVPERNPIITAKEVACLDQLSNGRFLFGIGAGWIREEAEIFGYDFDKRWPRTMDYMRAMKKLWTEEKPSYQGEYVSFPPIYCNPKPVQKPYPPILIGAGNPQTKAMPAILKRIAKEADGWIPMFFSPQEMGEQLKRLRELCDEEGRDFSKIDTTLIIAAHTLSVGDKFSALGNMDIKPQNPQELVAQYEEVGVTRIMVGFDELTKENGLRMLEQAAKGLKLH